VVISVYKKPGVFPVTFSFAKEFSRGNTRVRGSMHKREYKQREKLNEKRT